MPRSAAEIALEDAGLPDAPEAERTRVLTTMAHDAAEANATVVLVWQEGFAPFGLWIQITPISGIRLARDFVRGETSGWVGQVHAPHIGPGLEWFAPASEGESASRWSAVFADENLFVNLTLSASSFADLVARRSLVESTVLPSLVIAADAEPWTSLEELASGVIAAKEPWPQLTDAEPTG